MLAKASNNLIKDLKKQKRENSSLLFLDNFKIIKDAISSGVKPLYILVEDEKFNVWGDSFEIFKVDHQTIEQLSDSKTPQGVVCIAEYLQHIVEKPETNFLVLDSLQDPGNVGTLIRTATACGFEYVFLLDSVNVTNSKLVRSSVGTIFQSKIISMKKTHFIEKAKEWNLNLVMTDMEGENIFQSQFSQPVGVVIGNEGNGVCDEIAQICNYTIKIPMKKGVESLNASISGAVIMYEIAKNSFI